MKVKDITKYLESLAPTALQENYDNAGLLTGSPEWEITNILVTLDCTEPVVEEAISTDCNLIIAHHPIIFRGLKSLTGKNYVERTILKAIKNDIAIYAIHTNLDNIQQGVNNKIAEKLGLQQVKILSPKKGLMKKLEVFIPVDSTSVVLNAVYDSGAGHIGDYENCSFRVKGTGTFKPSPAANPVIGERGKQEEVEENKVEMIFPAYLETRVISRLLEAHPYEEVAHYITTLDNVFQDIGSGMVGYLKEPMNQEEFLAFLKEKMELNTIRFTPVANKKIQKVALCGGSGSFLLGEAKRSGANVFISADFKYHEFFDAEGQIMIADIGHYESEKFTKDLIKDFITKKFTTFAVNLSNTVTNPISYF